MLLALVKLAVAGAALWNEIRAEFPVTTKTTAEKAQHTPMLAATEALAQESEADKPADAAAQDKPAEEAQEPSFNARQHEARMEELRRRELGLKELEASIDAKLKRLAELEAKLQKMLEEADVLKDEKLRHLVDVYSNMKAKQAAEVLETLDQEIAVKILAGMRGRQAGEILTNVQPEKAAKLSEALTKLQTPFKNQ